MEWHPCVDRRDDLRGRMTDAGFSLGKGAIRCRILDPEKADILRDLVREVIARAITC